jgi:hypothetical protein
MGCMSKMPSSSPQSAACSTTFWANYFFYHGVHLVDRPYRGRALEDRVRVGPLRECLSRGHVGHCDSSKNRHPTKHYHGGWILSATDGEERS